MEFATHSDLADLNRKLGQVLAKELTLEGATYTTELLDRTIQSHLLIKLVCEEQGISFAVRLHNRATNIGLTFAGTEPLDSRIDIRSHAQTVGRALAIQLAQALTQIGDNRKVSYFS